MCGLTGVYYTNQACDRDRLVAMRDVIAHRGPDDSGEFIEAARDNALAKALRAERICGRVPESILLNLHLGDELRHGSSADKLSSFVSFWKSSLYSDLLIAAYKDSLRKDEE